MKEKWEMRCWNGEIRLCEQEHFMDAGARYDAKAERRVQYSG